jgi:hypothetical protein
MPRRDLPEPVVTPQGPCGLHVPMAQLVPRSALLLAKISAGMPIAAVASTALDA